MGGSGEIESWGGVADERQSDEFPPVSSCPIWRASLAAPTRNTVFIASNKLPQGYFFISKMGQKKNQKKNAPWHYVSILVNCPHLHAASHHHPHAPRKSSAESVQGILTCGAAARPTFTRRRAGSGHPTASTSGARPPWTAQIASEASPSRCINDASRMGGAKRGGFSDARRNQRARARRR